MLTARELTQALGGRWHGKGGMVRCPVHDDRTPSLSLADGADGRLLVRCMAGCSFANVMAALRNRGMADRGGDWHRPDPLAIARERAKAAEQDAQRERQAMAIWLEAGPITGTPAETYLRSRAITCPLPDSLRFHPDCWHSPTARRHPAMVARIDGANRIAIHRTYLAPDGRTKAAISTPRAMLGSPAGGAVRLSDGTGPLVVAEGLETALSLASGLLRGPATVWAALSTSGLRTLRLPLEPRRLTIATDGDDPGRAAGHDLGERAHALGWSVSLLPAPDGRDWNDVLMGKAVAK
jgi:hypothetical protein